MARWQRGFAGRRWTRLCATLLGSVALVLLLAAPASADRFFCEPGEGAGQCASPQGINALRGLAVDNETGRVYLADRNNNRVDVFKENGEFEFAFGWGVDTGAPSLQTCTLASTCQAGIAGSGAGQFDHAARIAVDNDPASPSRHDVYLAEGSNHRVQKFGPSGAFLFSVGASGEAEGQFTANLFAGVGPGGVLYALDNPNGIGENARLQRFKPNGEQIAPQCIAAGGGSARGFAVDPGGGFWVGSDPPVRGIRKFDAGCAPLVPGQPLDSALEHRLLAVDEAGDLFAQQREPRDKATGSYHVVTAYDPSGALLRRFGYSRIPLGEEKDPEGFVVLDGGGGKEGGVFLSVGDLGIERLDSPSPPLPPPGPIAAPSSVETQKIRSAKATAVAEVNPEGKETSVHFESISQADYAAAGNEFAGPGLKSTPVQSFVPESGKEFRLKTIEATLGCPDPPSEIGQPGNKCLKPNTAYRFRVVATNTDGGGEGTAEGTPFTTKFPLVIGATYATGVGTDTARLSAEVEPLEIPATGYFEYVDEESFGESGFAEAIKAPDVDAGQAPLNFGAAEEGFTTRSVSVFPLKPGTVYHYRLVADDPVVEPVTGEEELLRTFQPPSTESCPANEAFRIGPGALLPDCRAYEMVSPLDKGGADIRVLETNAAAPAVLEQASTAGDGLAYGSTRAFGDAASAPLTSQYIARRIAGSEWQTHAIVPPRGRPLVAVIGQTDTEFKAFSENLCEAWLIPFAEPPLSEGALAGTFNLYRRSDRLCGPEGYEALAPIVTPQGGGSNPELQGVSADGTHAIFRSNGKLAGEAGSSTLRRLYESVRGAAPRLVCVLPGGGTVSGACTAGTNGETDRVDTRGANVTGAISQDGERIYWSDKGVGEGKLYVRIGGAQTVAVSEAAETQAGSSASYFQGAAKDGSRAVFTTGGRLFEFILAGEETHEIAKGVVGVMGMSKDARSVYFASSKALTGEEENSEHDKAVEGKINLYLHEASEGGGQIEFIGTLVAGDVGPSIQGPLAIEPRNRTSRVSPDGVHAAFTSFAPLTEGLKPGEHYDNKEAGSGAAAKEVYLYDAAQKKLLCASCNPSGARPVGIVTEGAPFAATIPPFETQMHAARVLSDDGSRLYFESADTLSPQDSNGAVDVYQWEAPGAPCSTASPAYSAQDEGCIGLISSGQSPVDSRFVEATSGGGDVFFATLSGLLPQDYGLIDIYDARAGGGLPPPRPPRPPCEGDACLHPAATPEAPTPASSDYRAPKAARPGCPKGKKAVTKKGKKSCVPKKKQKQKKKQTRGRGGR